MVALLYRGVPVVLRACMQLPALTQLQRAAMVLLATAACMALALVPVARVSQQVTHRQQEPWAAKAFLSRKTLAP